VRQLSDGDRIRLGTQELVFYCMQAPTQAKGSHLSRSTGFLVHCAACGLPYPTEMVGCPSCGGTERSDEETMSGVELEHTWSLDLLSEVLSKAVSLGRWDDAERMLERAKVHIHDQERVGHAIDRATLDSLAASAAAVALAREEARWGEWIFAIYAERQAVPPTPVIERLAHLPDPGRQSLRVSALHLVQAVRGQHGSEGEELERVVSFVDGLDGGVRG
jgi:hypothetical protein